MNLEVARVWISMKQTKLVDLMVVKIPQSLGEFLLQLLRCVRLGKGIKLHTMNPLHGKDAFAAEVWKVFRETGVGEVLGLGCEILGSLKLKVVVGLFKQAFLDFLHVWLDRLGV